MHDIHSLEYDGTGDGHNDDRSAAHAHHYLRRFRHHSCNAKIRYLIGVIRSKERAKRSLSQ